MDIQSLDAVAKLDLIVQSKNGYSKYRKYLFIVPEKQCHFLKANGSQAVHPMHFAFSCFMQTHRLLPLHATVLIYNERNHEGQILMDLEFISTILHLLGRNIISV